MISVLFNLGKILEIAVSGFGLRGMNKNVQAKVMLSSETDTVLFWQPPYLNYSLL